MSSHLLLSSSINPPSSPFPAPSWWGRKHQGNTKRRWLLDLVTLKPATWTHNPGPVFHSISPTITCNTCLLTRSTEEGVYACVFECVLKRDGALCFYSPGRTHVLSRNFIEISGLIRPSQAKLRLYTDVLYSTSVPCPLFWADPNYCIFELREHMLQETLTVNVLLCCLILWWGLHHFM